MSEKKHKLTVFLIKETYEKPSDFINDEDGVRLVKIPLDATTEGALYYKTNQPTSPPWAKIFNGIPEFQKADIKNKHSKAILTFKTSTNWICFAFGYSRNLIRAGAIVRDFGLFVTLNLSDPQALKSIDKTNISNNSVQARLQTSRDAEIQLLDFDSDIDLLKAITAKSKKENEDDDELIISGRDSVTISSPIELSTFVEKAEFLLAAYKKDIYKAHYPWVDKISHERDPEVLDALDEVLLSSIKAEKIDKIWLGIPEIIDWEITEGFTFKLVKSLDSKKAGPIFENDLNLESWIAARKINIEELTLTRLKSSEIHQVGKDNQEVAAFSIYRCMNAEIEYQGSTYVLNDENWYKLQADFVLEINTYFESIQISSVQLPPYLGLTEPKYIDEVIKTNGQDFFKMDRKVKSLRKGLSSIEFCDLYSKNKELIHIKNYKSSATLSHLFSQATVSAECFLHDQTFRENINSDLEAAFKISSPEEKPNPSEYEICIAIMKAGNDFDLPFFSKVSLRHAVKTIDEMGYKVTKLKINRD